MSNTVITNYTDLNGPSTKADSSVVVIVNKDGSLSVDENLLGTLMGSDGSQNAGISVVRVGHEGPPDDATDSETDDDKVPHVTLTVDSYYDEPNSIIKYDSGADMLQSLRIETRENSLLGFQNDHCYTSFGSPDQGTTPRGDNFMVYDEPIIEIKQQSPPKSIPSSKKITILEQKIIPKGRKVAVNANEGILLKGNEALHKTLPSKVKTPTEKNKGKSKLVKVEESIDTPSSSSSDDSSIPDRDSDSDYKDVKDKSSSLRKTRSKPRILKKTESSKGNRLDPKTALRLKCNKNALKREIREKAQNKSLTEAESLKAKDAIEAQLSELQKETPKYTPKSIKKDKKTPAHVSALLSDMTSLFSTPDVIRRVSTDNKTPTTKDSTSGIRSSFEDTPKASEGKEKARAGNQRTYAKQKGINQADKTGKGFDLIPQIDDASLAQILQDTSAPVKTQPTLTSSNALNSPSLAGPLSPTLELLAGLQPEEEGLTEDLLMHVAQLVESSENLQEVIDKQVLGKVDTTKTPTTFQQVQSPVILNQSLAKTSTKVAVPPRKDPIEIVRKDGRVITLPPIEAPATRASKRKSQMESVSTPEVLPPQPVVMTAPQVITTEVQVQQQQPPKQPVPKKIFIKKTEPAPEIPVVEKASAESQESWKSEDDPYRLWCICRQPHNNRFMICCDGCEDWFHGKCVNVSKAMGHVIEEQGLEWRCPNCAKKEKSPKSITPKMGAAAKKNESEDGIKTTPRRQLGDSKLGGTKTSCIVCKKPARASSIYCSDACIQKYAHDSLGVQESPTKTTTDASPQNKSKSESRVVVFERKTRRCLAGPNAPTAENLKAWLQKNPTFEVVRPDTLSAIKPKLHPKKSGDQGKIQTTLNFQKIPKKVPSQTNAPKASPRVQESKESPSAPATKAMHTRATPSKEESVKASPKAAAPPKAAHPSHMYDSPKAGPSSAKPAPSSAKSAPSSAKPAPSSAKPAPSSAKPAPSSAKPIPSSAKPVPSSAKPAADKKPARASTSRLSADKTSVSPAASRRKDSATPKMDSADTIRENVKKALQEQMVIRMKETKGATLTEKDIQQFAIEVESELHDLFRDVGVKYKAKYRSLMFNIKDRKNLSLWEKICEKNISPKQIVQASPEELASQELAQWRDKESKYQLELIKKSELDLLAASKTYVLKTHKGEEVMETKESVSTELDPQIPVEDVVSALNDGEDGVTSENAPESKSVKKISSGSSKKSGKKKESESSRRQSKREAESRKGRSSRHTRRSERRHRERRRSEHRPTPHSTDSESVERPKSASAKETHPEYDPHEPMITSALSEEELPRADVYDDLKAAVDYGAPAGDLPFKPLPRKRGKGSEAESDQEPTSTVDNSSAVVWNGCINMVDVARFYVAAHEVSGVCSDLEEELSAELDIVGRINPDTVWDYINKMRRTGSKDIIVLRLQAANDEEKMQYIALYSYLSSRNRLGVVKVSGGCVKDLYVVPVSAGRPAPGGLLPGGAALDAHAHLLVAVVIRQRRKRPAAEQHDLPPKITRSSLALKTAPPQYATPALSSSVKEKITASIADDDSAYSPGGSSGDSPPRDPLRSKMEELNRQIEEQKQQILKMAQADSSVADEDEAYSPSRPLTPPPRSPPVPLSDIALPSNLQEILATIKQRSADVDMRTLPPT